MDFLSYLLFLCIIRHAEPANYPGMRIAVAIGAVAAHHVVGAAFLVTAACTAHATGQTAPMIRRFVPHRQEPA